jgi:peptidoglycan/LPS O-acetylase OafA/YrhL
MNRHRIELLDSFRFIAIISVLLYHFTNSWVTLYPYGNFFQHIFKYGYLGVHFFFMISGFVISYTLEKTPDLYSFFRNRFTRLFPPMFLCSLITFFMVRLLDDHDLFKNAHELKNLVPGLTFMNPSLWTLITNTDFHWINGSYWSLWVEIQFYVISSSLYFLDKKHFFRNILLAGIVLSIVKYIPQYFLNNPVQYLELHGLHPFFNEWKYGNEIFNLTFYITWFLSGVIMYELYKGFKLRQHVFQALCSLMILFCLVRDTKTFFTESLAVTIFASLLMFVLFLLMIYRKEYLFFLKNPLLIRIGVISYSIYLVHEETGILLIIKYGGYLGQWSPLAPFIMIIIVICFAELSYRFYEKRISTLLKKSAEHPILSHQTDNK